MAKVVLVCQHLHQTSWSLARALKAQNHEVVILTSKDETPPENDPHIITMSYFKRWSFIEATRLVPILFGLSPQIVHLLLDSDSMNGAESALALFAKGHPACILTTSLLHIHRGLHKRNPVRYLLQESDIITCPTLESMGHLRGLSTKKSQGRGILPPVLNLSEDLRSHQNDLVLSEIPILDALKQKKYVILPFREPNFDPTSPFFRRLLKWGSQYHLVLWGSFQMWPPRQRKIFAEWMENHGLQSNWTLTGRISAGITEQLLEGCEALILAGQSFTPIEMTEFYLKAIQTRCSLVLSRRQAQVHAGLWRHGKNCWILEDRKIDLEIQKVLLTESLRTPEQLPESIAREKHWIDIPLNDLNRLYNKALMSK